MIAVRLRLPFLTPPPPSSVPGHQRLAYAELLPALGLQDVRDLEDILVTNCIGAGLVRGRLDQAEQCLLVEESVARDASPAQLSAIAASLGAWWVQHGGQNRGHCAPQGLGCRSIVALYHLRIRLCCSSADGRWADWYRHPPPNALICSRLDSARGVAAAVEAALQSAVEGAAAEAAQQAQLAADIQAKREGAAAVHEADAEGPAVRAGRWM